MIVAYQMGISPSQFHACPDEWAWLERYYTKYKKAPSKLAFKQQFPEFGVKAVNDTAHFAAEVRKQHARQMLTRTMRDVADNIAAGDIDSAVGMMHSSIVHISADMGDGTEDSDIITSWQDTYDEVEKRVERVEEHGMAGVPTGFTTLDERTGGPQPGHVWIVGARLGSGKALSNDELVWTPRGQVRMGDIRVGDTVTGSDGRATEVIAVHPQGQKRVHRVTFSDGTVIKACEDHLWTTRIGSKPWKVRTTANVMKWLANGNQQPSVPTLSAPIQFDGSEHLVPSLYNPYLLGLLIGDGCFSGKSVQFTTADPELVAGWGRNAVKWVGRYAYGISRLKQTIEALGLWGTHSWDKFIPPQYKVAPPRVRHAILQGLFDTDGSVTKTGGVEYTTTSKRLADDVREIVESLGGFATVHERVTSYTHHGVKKDGRVSYRMFVAMPDSFPPFRLQRKADQWKPRIHPLARSIVSVEPTDEYVDMTCITVDAPDSLFATRGCILTHNSWTMMRMATAAIMEGYNVQYNALEQTRAEVAMRIHTFLSTAVGRELFRNLDLMQGRNFDLESYREFLHSMKDEISGKMHVSDTSRGKVSPLTIASQIERNKPDIVFIDYLTLMEKSGDGDWKGQPLDTPVPTPGGWSTMGELKVGDQVFDMDGRVCSVVGKSPLWTDRRTYRVTFNDGEVAYCDGEHEWVFEIPDHRRPQHTRVVTMRTDKAMDHVWSKEARPYRQLRVVNSSPLSLPDADLPIPPYTLGAWLGDGNHRSGLITKPDEDLFVNIEADGYAVKPPTDAVPLGRRIVGLTDDLKAAGLIQNKYIPPVYLRGSVQQRLALLQGLMDTDGTWNIARNQAVFTNTNKALVDGVTELARSLGWKPRVWTLARRKFGQTKRPPIVDGDVYWDVTFTPCNDLNPFRVIRKASLVRANHVQARHRIVTSVEMIEHIDTVCIGVDSPTHTYLTGHGMIPTHNSIAKLSGEMKNLAMQYQVPIVCAAQLNRAMGLGKEPAGPEALAQSDSIGQDADAVITIRQSSQSVLHMKLAKYRHGLAGFKWHCQFQPGAGVFKEVTHTEAQLLKDADDEADDND